ncbi:uridine kinase [Peptoniphilus sp. KCTC 25270]|uniref:uridine kinase n=1 Tax=Peptoniphilus sp. KCTC 25270 TaxID=2897414 RepID=UPI001E57D0C0|nr:uridine kinase [Peptoniphilus sp. KCTC 25270]MCD1147168.1 uridine kinase [Peptoniphilus sp. KCTC 25270]
MKPVIIGIAGGSGSGKSTVTKQLMNLIDPEKTLILRQDNYYKDQSDLPYDERIKTNYDHPFAFDNELLVQHIMELKDNKIIEVPEYDFTVHNRKKETTTIVPKEIILVEGILIFADENIRNLCDIKIFVDTDSDVRVLRRIKRDIRDRGRSLESVIEQYLETVRPAHLQFVEPSKSYADVIVPEGGHNRVAIDLLETKINSIIEKNKKE